MLRGPAGGTRRTFRNQEQLLGLKSGLTPRLAGDTGKEFKRLGIRKKNLEMSC